MRRHHILGICLTGLITSTLIGCGGSPAMIQTAEPAPPRNPYVDWDQADWRVDRYILVNVKDFVTNQNLGTRDPASDYRTAITYAAVWDSLGLIPFLALNDAEQADRRRLATNHVAEARRIVLGTVNHYWKNASSGFHPNLDAIDSFPNPVGVETAVTAAITHLTIAAGMDPTNPAAWRDLAYFFGVVGDWSRQQHALSSALAALDQIDPAATTTGDLARLRRDVLMDLAWLARDMQQPDLTIAYLDHAGPWIQTPSRERFERNYEATLLRGLALADQGEWLAALGQSRDLPRIQVTSRALRGGVREDLRWHLDAPHFEALGYDRSAWPRQESDFGRRWIKALAGAPSGNISHMLWLLGAPPTHLEFPPRLASRYWQDQGRLYTRGGDFETARHCFEWSAMYRPYMAFFPLGGSEAGPSRMGVTAANQRYFTGYGRFFLCGDRGAFNRDVATSVTTRP